MFSLSTSWNAYKHTNGMDLVREIKDIGFDTIELNFTLTKNIVEDILSLKEDSKIKVSSLHNMCPLPEGLGPSEASPDYYSLASLDDGVRARAVEVTKNTIDYARKFGAKIVILHIGRVEVKDRFRDLADSIDDKKEFDSLKAEMIKERDENKGPYLKSVMKSLEELSPYAKKMKTALAIENRYYYREIPLIEELEEIFKSFKAGNLFYWHDTGHAEVFERLGFARHKDFLDRFPNRLIGMHLHDIIGPIGDHNAPGSGEFDFRMLKPYIKEDTIKVIEAHKQATADDIRRSVKYLTKILGS